MWLKMVTRQENTFNRDLTFSQWVRNKLPDSSTGFWVSDIDFIFFNRYKHTLMLLEIKQHDRDMRFFQKNLFSFLDKVIKKGINEIDSNFNYLGFHLLKFENKDWNDGKVWYDTKEIKEDEFVKFIYDNF